eukprot:7918002-Alexandrium_andersonii.AAC.1
MLRLRVVCRHSHVHARTTHRDALQCALSRSTTTMAHTTGHVATAGGAKTLALPTHEAVSAHTTTH